MASRRYPPASLRYFKARLLNFTRPAFWGTAIFLSITGLAIQEFWINPDLLTGSRNRERTENNSRLSPEERAIAADIDNLPVLFFDFEQAILPTLNAAKAQTNRSNKNTSRIGQESKSQETKINSASRDIAKASSTAVDNQFLKQAENLLKLEPFQAGINRFSNAQLTGGDVNRTSNHPPVNPLEAELNPSLYPQYSRLTGKATNPTPLEQALNQSTTTNPNTGLISVPNRVTNNLPNNSTPTTNFNSNYTNDYTYSQPLTNPNNSSDYPTTINTNNPQPNQAPTINTYDTNNPSFIQQPINEPAITNYAPIPTGR